MMLSAVMSGCQLRPGSGVAAKEASTSLQNKQTMIKGLDLVFVDLMNVSHRSGRGELQ